MKTIPSPNRHKGRKSAIRLIIEHTMEASEDNLSTAENVARYFQRPSVRASAHVCTDANSDVRCVANGDTAWAAPGANHDGLQHELAGYAGQGADDWSDARSTAILKRAARVQAQWARAYGIPLRWLTVAQVRDGKSKGFCTHDDVSKAFGRSTHWDPGPNFPKARFMNMVRGELGQPSKDDSPADDGKLAVDGKWGRDVTTATQRALDVDVVDGEISRQNEHWEKSNPGCTTGWDWIDRDRAVAGKGSPTIRADQARLKKAGHYKGDVDGLAGPEYFKGVQREGKALKLYTGRIDGRIDYPSKTVKARQRALNEGKIKR